MHGQRQLAEIYRQLIALGPIDGLGMSPSELAMVHADLGKHISDLETCYLLRPSLVPSTKVSFNAWEMAAPGYPLKRYETKHWGVWAMFMAAREMGEAFDGNALVASDAKNVGEALRQQVKAASSWLLVKCPPLALALEHLEITRAGIMRYSGRQPILTK